MTTITICVSVLCVLVALPFAAVWWPRAVRGCTTWEGWPLVSRIGGLCLLLGAFQFAQHVFATLCVWEPAPGFQFNPGSAVLYPLTLTALLVCYRQGRADVTALAVLAIGIANGIAVGIVCLIRAAEGGTVPGDPGFESAQSAWSWLQPLWARGTNRIMFYGTALLLFEAVVMWAVTRWSIRHFRSGFWRTLIPLVCVLSIDSILYPLLKAWVHPAKRGWENLWPEVSSHLASKWLMGLVYSVLVARFFAPGRLVDESKPGGNLSSHPKVEEPATPIRFLIDITLFTLVFIPSITISLFWRWPLDGLSLGIERGQAKPKWVFGRLLKNAIDSILYSAYIPYPPGLTKSVRPSIQHDRLPERPRDPHPASACEQLCELRGNPMREFEYQRLRGMEALLTAGDRVGAGRYALQQLETGDLGPEASRRLVVLLEDAQFPHPNQRQALSEHLLCLLDGWVVSAGATPLGADAIGAAFGQLGSVTPPELWPRLAAFAVSADQDIAGHALDALSRLAFSAGEQLASYPNYPEVKRAVFGRLTPDAAEFVRLKAGSSEGLNVTAAALTAAYALDAASLLECLPRLGLESLDDWQTGFLADTLARYARLGLEFRKKIAGASDTEAAGKLEACLDAIKAQHVVVQR